MYEKLNIEITGDTLIMHNGRTANPLDPYSKAMKELSGKRNKTDADNIRLSRLEYEAGLYVNKDNLPIIPSRILEANICEGARKTKEGKLALSGLFVDTDADLEFEGGPMTVEELVDSEDHKLTVSVRIGQSRVMRTRPLFKDWRAMFTCSINASVATPSQLKQWLENAGKLVGVGDWRPRYGRFEVVSFG